MIIDQSAIEAKLRQVRPLWARPYMVTVSLDYRVISMGQSAFYGNLDNMFVVNRYIKYLVETYPTLPWEEIIEEAYDTQVCSRG